MHEMSFIYNFPFFSIILTLASAMATPFIKNGKIAQKLNMATICGAFVLNLLTLIKVLEEKTSVTYLMGHFPAPFGNEIKFGPLEALMSTAFCVVMALSILGGLKNIYEEIPKKKQNLYFLMMNLILCSLISMVYTNDMFNAYVFIEINTIAACAIVMAKDTKETTVATIRYLIMSQIGSGLVLLSLALIYNVTGQLLMTSLHTSIGELLSTGQYVLPFAVFSSIMVVALAIKSAAYPFHTWLPNAHGSATSASSAILSGLVLKGYIILLIKIIYRVYSQEIMQDFHITDVIFILGILSMIMGSVNALSERHIKRMTAYSTVAQIGYIFMGIGIGNEIGVVAALLHILVHAITKPMLFNAAGALANVSGHSYEFKDLKGAAHKNKLAGVAFVVGSLSMIGIPLFAGFAPKLFFSFAALEQGDYRSIVVLIALAISTILNALYYIPVCFKIWQTKEEVHHHDEHEEHTEHISVETGNVNEKILNIDNEEKITHEHEEHPPVKMGFSFKFAMVIFIILNVLLGILYQPIINILELGLKLL